MSNNPKDNDDFPDYNPDGFTGTDIDAITEEIADKGGRTNGHTKEPTEDKDYDQNNVRP